jgi:hypothetical protein
MNLEPPAPPEAPAPPSRTTFGLQVAYGFLLAPFAFLVQMLVAGVFSTLKGGWSGPGMFVSGVVGMLVLLAGIWLAIRRRWRGVLHGFLLLGALVLLLIGACFVMLAKVGR